MYILKNAIISITRNKGRNILLAIIIIVIGCATTVALAIVDSADKLISSYESQYDIEATISVNRENMMNNFRGGEEGGEEKSKEDRIGEIGDAFGEASNISVEDIENYADSDFVKSYYYTRNVSMNSSNIEKASASFGNDDKGNENFFGKGMNDMGQNENSGDFSVVGYSSIEAMNDFILGNYHITSGSVSTDFSSSTCVINEELAELNDISVGDKITLVSPNDESITYELEVVGIFEDSSDDSNEGMSMFTGSVNSIITNVDVVNKILSLDGSLMGQINPTFVLTSEDVIDDFSEELSDKGLSEYLTVSTNLETISSATKSISNLKSYATTFLVIILIIGVIVLLVLNAINIRERRYEIGVLRTIGMKKSLLTCQFALELLIVTLVGLMIGASIGAVTSVPISNHLLESEIESSQNKMEDTRNNFGGEKGEHDFERMNGVQTIEAYDSIDAAVNLKVLGELLLIGIVLTVISSISSMVSIQRFSPLQILKERS